jgi:hypothetical protein
MLAKLWTLTRVHSGFDAAVLNQDQLHELSRRLVSPQKPIMPLADGIEITYVDLPTLGQSRLQYIPDNSGRHYYYIFLNRYHLPTQAEQNAQLAFHLGSIYIHRHNLIHLADCAASPPTDHEKHLQCLMKYEAIYFVLCCAFPLDRITSTLVEHGRDNLLERLIEDYKSRISHVYDLQQLGPSIRDLISYRISICDLYRSLLFDHIELAERFQWWLM